MSPVDSLTARLLAERHFPKYDVNEWAVMVLEAGFDSKHLRMLAATIPNDWPSISEDIERKALAELGWDNISQYEYLLEHARSLASDILEGRADPEEGSGRIYRLMTDANLRDELSGWYEIDEMLYSRGYFHQTGKKDYFYVEPAEFDRKVKEHCQSFLLATNPKTARLPETGFDEAEEVFREFLVNNKYPGTLLWVFADDLIIRPSKIDCYVPDRESNREAARCLYDVGVRRGHGIGLHVFARLNDKLLAYVLLPEDKLDSEYKLMSKDFVKFSARTPLRYEVREVTIPAIWKLKNLFINNKKRTGYESEIRFRSESK